MAKFLTTRGTSSNLENIINAAERSLVLISPYIKIPETLFPCLKAADKKNVKITLIYGKKDDLNDDVIGQLRQLRNLSLYFDRNLHAKCYFNEASMVITSMNLYDYSESSNREMGVLVSATEDRNLYNEAEREYQRILGIAELVGLGTTSTRKQEPKRVEIKRQETEKEITGHCIRCKSVIPLDPSKPYCRDCYDVWNKWKDPEYEEKYCHWCGKPTKTTIEYPLCRPCYRKLT